MNPNLQGCLVTYHNHGIQFMYPDFWEISEDVEGHDIIITVSGTDSCFWTLRILPACPPPPQVVESCVSAYREEYEDVEVEQTEHRLAEMPACSRDLEFFCMELLNTAGLRSVRTAEFTLLVWWQGTQHELAECQPIFEQMTASLRADSLLD